MELDHEFTVPVPVDAAWSVLLDVERVALCMPGATLDAVDGDEYTGRLKVKLGAMTITYRGTARITMADEAARKLTLDAAGKEARGSGTASATVRAELHEEGHEGTATRVTVHTKLNVTGRPAQFGRNILSEVGSKLISRFAKNLSEELAADRPASAPAAAPADKPVAGAAAGADTAPAADEDAGVPQQQAGEPATVRPIRAAEGDNDAIDLLEVAGPSVAKRAIPAGVGLLATLLAVRYLFRRRRGRHGR